MLAHNPDLQRRIYPKDFVKDDFKTIAFGHNDGEIDTNDDIILNSLMQCSPVSITEERELFQDLFDQGFEIDNFCNICFENILEKDLDFHKLTKHNICHYCNVVHSASSSKSTDCYK